MLLVAVQPGGAVTRWHGGTVRVEDVSTAADTEAGTIHAGVALPAGGHVANDGQRSHVLRSSCSLHLHLQVC